MLTDHDTPPRDSPLTDLLLILTPIGLLDSLSMVPLCIMVMIVLIAGPRAIWTSAAFLVGIVLIYFVFGLLVLLGLQAVFDQLDALVTRIWRHPNTGELIVQLLLGIALCVFGVRIQRSRKKRGERTISAGMSPLRALLAGVGLTTVGLPGAVPYLAAIDLVRRDNLVLWQEVAALLYYSVIFIVPITAIMAVGALLGRRGRQFQDAIQRFLDLWGQRVVVALLILLGVVLAADAIGWFFGYPLIPVD